MARALIRRLEPMLGIRMSIIASITSGHGGILTEIKGFQLSIKTGAIPSGSPDLLLVLRDANCAKFSDIKKEIVAEIDNSIFPFFVVGCPDPHVERWLLIDSQAISQVFGFSAEIPSYKCERDFYKNALKNIIRQAGWPITQDGIEYSHDIITNIHLHRAGKNDSSFNSFLSELRATLKQLKSLNAQIPC